MPLQLTLELKYVSQEYQMVIPSYFSLILRAFSTIEGIALKVDPTYSIINECMPYLSRRLLSDNNPRMRAALRQLLYGGKQRIDMDRLHKMVSSFGTFTTGAFLSLTFIFLAFLFSTASEATAMGFLP